MNRSSTSKSKSSSEKNKENRLDREDDISIKKYDDSYDFKNEINLIVKKHKTNQSSINMINDDE